MAIEIIDSYLSKRVLMQVANMRKPQDFIIYPCRAWTQDKPIYLQSEKRWMQVYPCGLGYVSAKNQNYPNSLSFVTVGKKSFNLMPSDLETLQKAVAMVQNKTNSDGSMTVLG